MGKVSFPLILGFGLHWAWIFSAVFSIDILFPFRVDAAADASTTVSMLFMSLTLLSYTLFFKKIRPCFASMTDRRRVRLIGAVLTSAGVLVACVASVSAAQVLAYGLGVVAGVLTGVGSAALLMSYGVSFSICDTAAAAMQFALGCVIACLGYGVILVIDSYVHMFGMVVSVILPWLELVCLNACSKQLVDRTEFVSMMMPINQRKFAFHLGPSAFSFGLLFGFLGQHAFRDIADLSVLGGRFVYAVFVAGIVTCLLVVGVMLTQRQQANYAFRTLNPIIAVVIAILSFLVPAGITTTSAHCLFLVSYLLIEACMWISFSDMSQKFRISPFHVFGVGRGFLALGAVVSTIFMLPASPLADFLNSTDAILPVAIVLLMFGASSYPRDAEVVRVLERGNLCPAFFDPFDVANEPRQALAHAREAASAADAGSVGETVDACAGADAPTGGFAPSSAGIDHAGEEPSATLGTLEGSCDGAPSGDSSDDRDTSIACPDASGASASDEQHLSSGASRAMEAMKHAGSAGPDGAVSDEERIGRYKRRCLALANMCLLSRRETEVLFLLAKGYNTKMIQEQLYISAGTANTHMRHVYRKLDVHSQQDLIRMVDSMQVEDEDW